MHRRLLVAGVAIAAASATSLGTAASAAGATAGAQKASAATAPSTTSITGATRALGAARTTTFVPGKQGSLKGVQKNEIQREPLEGSGRDGAARAAKPARVQLHDRSLTPRPTAAQSARVATAGRALALPSGIVRTGARLVRSFEGLTHRDQRLADNGNQFSLEPPDQALCVGKGYVVEGVNDAVRVDTTSGKRGGVMSLNKFFGLPVTIDRAKGVFGPFATDPTCVYDSSTGTFYFVMLEIAADPKTGDLSGNNYLDIAVTQNPTGKWRIYRLAVQDDGSEGTPVHGNCPCLGDYPHIGFDAYGFYITTNEYPWRGTPDFNSAQVYAFDKRALATNAKTIFVTQFETPGVEHGRNGFTIWPAHSPSASDFDRRLAGTAYFLSSNAAEEARGGNSYTSNSIVFWAMTGTSTLNRAHPGARLRVETLPVARYSLPPLAAQKEGPAPLRDCLNDPACVKALLGPDAKPSGEVLSRLDANDTRMQQVMFVRGRLYGALDTAVKLPSGVQPGIAWYVVDVGRIPLHARVVAQGQFGVNKQALTYPAIGVTDSGRGVISFTLTGSSFFPTAAFAGFTAAGPQAIQVASLGKAPEDGFTGYRPWTNVGAQPRSRWGDYGAASVAGNDVWVASEYIGARGCTLAQYETSFSCGGTRTALANWTTRVSQVRP